MAIAKAKEELKHQRFDTSFRDNFEMSKDADVTIFNVHGEDGEGALKGIIEVVSKGPSFDQKVVCCCAYVRLTLVEVCTPWTKEKSRP